MNIQDIWKLTEKQISKSICMFNTLKVDRMILAVQCLKLKMKQFIEYLENILDAAKKNLQITQKKQEITETKGERDKNNFEDSLSQFIIKQKPNVKWTDIAGLDKAKLELQQAVILPIKYPEIFVGQRKLCKGILLYGPPGTGKTYLAKACATQMQNGTLFSISSSNIMSKYISQTQKIMNTLFKIARKEKASIIFIDQIDSMGNRVNGENQTNKKIKTQYLTQIDSFEVQNSDILILGATNLPWALDPQIRRKFEKRIYIGLPDQETRKGLIQKLCSKIPNNLNQQDFVNLGKICDGFSCFDIQTLVHDAACEPLRIASQNVNQLKAKNQKSKQKQTSVFSSKIPVVQYIQRTIQKSTVKNVLSNLQYHHFLTVMTRCKPSVSNSDINRYREFALNFGQDG